MAITTPIIRPLKPTFNPGSGLRSPLDKDDLTNAHKKAVIPNGSTFNLATQVQQLSVLVNKLRRRVLTPPTTPLVYQLNAFSIYAIGGGFQIRDGIIGFRSKYFLSTDLELSGGSIINSGSYEIPVYCQNTDLSLDNTQFPGIDFSRQPANYSSSPQTLDAGGVATIIGPLQTIVIPPTYANGHAVFWVEITDDPAHGITVATYGKITNPQMGDNFSFYPQGANVFPIGYVSYFQGVKKIQQYQTGNLTNRYLPYTIGGNSPLNYRGRWSADSLSGQAFYDGDVVEDDSQVLQSFWVSSSSGGAVTTNLQFYGAFVYTAGAAIETTNPAANLANWTRIWKTSAPA